MKLEGTLETFPIRELIDMVVYSSVTGVLNIYGPVEAGHLFFRDGSLYHVERGTTQGVDALAELMEQLHGTFSFVSDVVSEEESLWGSLTHHLQTAERLAVRWRQLRPYVPSLELVPQLIVPREAAQRRVPAIHQPVLGLIDGHSSLRQIAAALSWAEVELAEAVVQMTVDGLVDLRSSRTRGQGPEEPTGEGLFDRLLPRGPAPGRAVEGEGGRQAHSLNAEDLVLRLLRG